MSSLRYRPWTVVFTFILAAALPASAQIDAHMFRYPDVSADQIAFVYAGDIWVVDKGGGVAKRLSSPPGEESFPRFSPDGARIAFSGNYDGNIDIYVVPAGGGAAERVTYHPDPDRLLDWTPDGGELLFASPRTSGTGRFRQLFTVSAAGGLPQRLPVAYGEFGTLSPDGSTLAFTPKSREFRNWKRYRGGMAPEIWTIDLESLEAFNLSDSDANDMQPMWFGDTVYFLSDRGPQKRLNIWSIPAAGGTARQVTNFTDFDVSWPAIGPSDMVFEAGGRLWRLELPAEELVEVEVEVVTDLAGVRPRRIKVADRIEWGDISPSGKRAVFEARGNIHTVPAEHGPVLQLTTSSGSAERFPAWSPDGATIAYWSDASGEYELVLHPTDPSKQPRTVTELGPGYRYQIQWSPDSKKIAFIDHTATIFVYDVAKDTMTEVDRFRFMLHGGRRAFRASWSADSRWLAYARDQGNFNNAIFLYDTVDGERHQVTSGFFSDFGPVFDPDGSYLYYLSNRTLEPIYSDVDTTWIYPNSTVVVAAPLRSDVASPLAPRNDEEGADEDDDEEEESNGEAEDDGGKNKKGKKDDVEEKKDKPEPVEIELEGFESRIVVLPPDAGNFGRLDAVSGKVVFHRAPNSGSGDEASPLLYWDLEEREEKTIISDIDDYEISTDGKKLIVVKDDRFAIVDVGADQKMEKTLATDALETVLDPRAEWRQMFRDVWRTYRDIFYDANMHGLDWDDLGERYGSLIDHAASRWDVNFLIGELIAEVSASHTYIFGGDLETPRRRQIGLLGVDWTIEDGAYRIERIVRGAPWNNEARSPIAESGVEISEGDYVLAVNGRPLDVTRDPYAAFEGLAGQTVQLTVNDSPSMEGARRVLVETLGSERRLRNLEWIDRNRRRVAELSGGRIGYVFVPDTGIRGQTELVRQFSSQMKNDGLIIDERFNGGGQIPDRFVELFNRRVIARIFFRHGESLSWPPVTHVGPKAMLINGWAGSGGDAFPDIFKTLEVGPLVGERTWGGLIGPATRHGLIDGGGFTAPQGRFYGPDDSVWFAEGHGVDPDIPVVDHPGAMAKGGDPQLEKAVEVILDMLAENPPTEPEVPLFEER
jgi:tricorn protease